MMEKDLAPKLNDILLFINHTQPYITRLHIFNLSVAM